MNQSHYFNPDPSLDHQHQIIGYSLSGHNFSFKTDKGVFSKDKVDHGTNVMLKAILKDQNNFPDQAEITALDFGCGYGVVSIVLQEIFANENYFKKQNWFSLDINQRAIALAKQNAIRSGAKISFLESDGIPLDFGKFDFIFLNPPIRAGKAVYYQMFEQAADHLEKSGNFYIVIQKKQGANSAVAFLKTLFNDVKVIDKTSGFHTIRCQFKPKK